MRKKTVFISISSSTAREMVMGGGGGGGGGFKWRETGKEVEEYLSYPRLHHVTCDEYHQTLWSRK